MSVVTLQDVKDARKRIASYIKKTELRHCPEIEKFIHYTSGKIFLKLDNQQETNTFKVRGAYNTMLQLTPEQKKKGVVTRSSGNFAQAVALAAHTLKMKATIVMPEDAPEVKKQGTAKYHPTIVYIDKRNSENDKKVNEISELEGSVIVYPYNHPHVIAGQGTAALEIVDDLPTIKNFFSPIGGGGLMSGCATTFKAIDQSIHTIGVEPEGANDYYLSRKTHKPVTLEKVNTIADGLRANTVGEYNRPLLDAYVDTVDQVKDEEIISAMIFAWRELKLKLEPSGATALASLLFHKHPLKGDVVCFISGANVDEAVFQKCLNS